MKNIITILILALSISAFSQSNNGIDTKLVGTSGEIYSDEYAAGNSLSYGIGISKRILKKNKFSMAIGAEALFMKYKPYSKATNTKNESSTFTIDGKNIYKLPVYITLRQDFKYFYLYSNLGYHFGTKDPKLVGEYIEKFANDTPTITRYEMGYTNNGFLIDIGLGTKFTISNTSKMFVTISTRSHLNHVYYNSISSKSAYYKAENMQNLSMKNYLLLSTGISF